MKNIFLLLTLISIASFSINAQSVTFENKTEKEEFVPTKPNAPQIVFTENEHDFGTLDEGPKVTYEFKFTNDGKEPLVLTEVKASCGCTVPVWPKEPILPGEEAVIAVTYNTQNRVGNFKKAITIRSNAEQATKIIYIKGEVVKANEADMMPIKSPMMSPE